MLTKKYYLFVMLFLIASPIVAMSNNNNGIEKKCGSLITGIGLGAFAGIAIAVYNDPKSVQQSYDYINAIPTPIKFFCVGVGATLIGLNFMIRSKFSQQKSLLASQEIRLANQEVTLVHLERISKELNKVLLELQKVIVIQQNIIEDHSKQLEINSNVCCRLSIVKTLSQDRIKTLEQQQKAASFLVDIFKEVQEDARYREKVVRAEQVEQNRCRHNQYNLGGVE